jgi:hypothetical protein
LEDLISGPTISAFRVQGWHTTNKIISEGEVDSSSSEQGPVVGYSIQSNELLGFIKYGTFLITWRINSQLLKNCAPLNKFIVLVIFWFYIHKQYFQLLGHMVAQLVEVLCYKPEVHRFISQWDHWIFFSIYLILPATLWPQPLTEMSTRNQTFNKEISQAFLCSGMPLCLVWTLHTLSSAIVSFKVGFPHVSTPHEILHKL